jgi:hypothetical protein
MGVVLARALVDLSREYVWTSGGTAQDALRGIAKRPTIALNSTTSGGAEVPDPAVIGKARTWADTPDGRVCRSIFPLGESFGGPLSGVWADMRPYLLNASFRPFDQYVPKDDDEREELRELRRWVSALMDFYTYERMRRSQAHPAPFKSVKRILRLVRDRLDDPDKHGPVRIAVMGGSVAVGRGSEYSPFKLTAQSGLCYGKCAYVDRLRHLLNTVLFADRTNGTHPVFEVTNLATAGTNSEVGAMALEYRVIPTIQHHAPHVMISSYSANDSNDPDLRKTFLVDQQAFVRAAHRLRPCDDDLPLVVLADDYFGPFGSANNALEQSGTCGPCLARGLAFRLKRTYSCCCSADGLES